MTAASAAAGGFRIMEENKDKEVVPNAPVDAGQEPEKKGRDIVPLLLKITAALYIVSLIVVFAFNNPAKAKKSAVSGTSEITADEAGNAVGAIHGYLSKPRKSSVGVIPVYGVISQSSSNSPFGIQTRGSQGIANSITKLADRKEIKAVVLDINSPGGSVGAVQEIYSAILKAKEKTNKPFIARFGEVSASGGYYIAAACDKIIAQPGTLTGSIGVIFSAGDASELMKKIGYRSEVIKSGKFKDIGSMTRPMTEEEKALLQDMIDDSYGQFVDAVSAGRKMTVDRVKQLADGRIYTGRRALKEGLVDQLGDWQDALDLAGTMAGIGKNPAVYYYKDTFDDLISSFFDMKTNITSGVVDYLTVPKVEYRWDGR